MGLKRRLVAGLVLGAVFVLIEFLVNGVFLRALYRETTALWRPESEMKSLMWLMALGQFFFGTLFGIVYAKGYEPRRAPLGQGVRYGLIMGLMLAPMNALVWYVVLPVPVALAAAWIVAGFAEMLILGVAASQIYKP